MQTYQSYFPNNYSNYPQYTQQVYPQNMQMQQGIQGKFVDSIESVRATDIPMDGRMYYFPKADGSEIYIKRWNQDGTTSIMTYKPVPNAQEEKKSPNDEVLSKLDEMLNQLNVLVKTATGEVD